MAYAEGTTVPVNKSKNEVERLLRKFGAEQFAYVSGSDKVKRPGFSGDSAHLISTSSWALVTPA